MNKKEIIKDMKSKNEKFRKVILRRPDGSKRVTTYNLEPTLTDQQFKDESDPNHIIDKYKTTGQLTYVSKIQGKFADVSNVNSLHQSLIQVQKAKDDFMHLSSDVRKKFNNSVIELVQFLDNPENLEEALKLGLVEKSVDNLQKVAQQQAGGKDAKSNKQTVSTMETNKNSTTSDPDGNRSDKKN